MPPVTPQSSVFSKKVILWLVCIAIATLGLFVGGSHLFEQGMATKTALVAERETDLVYGSTTAPVRFILYGDASCQYCRVLYPKIKALVDSNPDKAALIYRHRPIYDKGYDTNLLVDMLVAQCVGKMGGSSAYYTYLDTLYQSMEAGVRMSNIPFSLVETAVTSTGLSLPMITECTENSDIAADILAEREQLRTFGARVVPYTFVFIDGDMYEVSGNKPIEVYEEFITWSETE